MKVRCFVAKALLPALILFSTTVAAGQISGTIRNANGPLVGIKVSINCNGKTSSGTTDDSGRYNIYVAATGPCTLTTGAASAQVFSSHQPTRHNFILLGSSLKRQ